MRLILDGTGAFFVNTWLLKLLILKYERIFLNFGFPHKNNNSVKTVHFSRRFFEMNSFILRTVILKIIKFQEFWPNLQKL